MRDENRAGARWDVNWIVIGKSEQEAQHANVHVGEIANALTHHRARRAREALARFDHLNIERLLGRNVLMDELLDTAREIGILEDGELNLEDRRLFWAGARLDA